MQGSIVRSVLASVVAGFVIITGVLAASPAAMADSGTGTTSQVTTQHDANETQAAWDCIYGYPCLYDFDNGQGVGLARFPCGFTNLYDLGNNYEYANWANSIRTYANTVTVKNWNSKTQTWENYGTVPAWSKWNFTQKNVIDGITVNC